MFDKRIVVIHDVAGDTMKPRRLENIIKVSKALGYRFISLEEILNDRKRGLQLALTIDDAYKSCITTILPILEKHNIKATLFVPTGLIGLKATDPLLRVNECYPDKDIITWDDLQQWKMRGQEIGYHTHCHIDMYHHSDSEIVDDFLAGIKCLSAQGLNVKYFAYPKGFLPKNKQLVENLFSEHGIECAFTINRGAVNIDNPYYIHRTTLGNKEKFLWSMCKIFGLEDFYFYHIKKSYVEAKLEKH
ncbi:MAG: polysaccharide deacetylase family protein [Bacteroidales bacterium]